MSKEEELENLSKLRNSVLELVKNYNLLAQDADFTERLLLGSLCIMQNDGQIEAKMARYNLNSIQELIEECGISADFDVIEPDVDGPNRQWFPSTMRC